MLFTPFTFQNGKTAKNRIFKSAMEEQLAQNDQPLDSDFKCNTSVSVV